MADETLFQILDTSQVKETLAQVRILRFRGERKSRNGSRPVIKITSTARREIVRADRSYRHVFLL